MEIGFVCARFKNLRGEKKKGELALKHVSTASEIK